MKFQVIAKKILTFNQPSVNGNIYTQEVLDKALADPEFVKKLDAGKILVGAMSGFSVDDKVFRPDAVCGKVISLITTQDGLYGTFSLEDETVTGRTMLPYIKRDKVDFGCIGQGEDVDGKLTDYNILGVTISIIE